MRCIPRRHHAALLAGLGVVVALVVVAILAYHRQVVAPQVHPAPSSTATVPSFAHVVIVIEENKPATAIIGNAAAPYINGLANEYAQATDYHAVTNPSLPNYIALTSGTTGGITNDCNPPGRSCQADVPSIADEIERSGRRWKMYGEGMPAPCQLTNAGRYAVKHVPFLYYPAIRNDAGRCRQHVVPFSQLNSDLKTETSLPDYAFITPDLCNDMHDCSVRTGDDWLAREVPSILGSPAFVKQNSLLVVTWDEGDWINNHVPIIFAGPAAKKSFASAVRYDHYSLLHTIEKAWGLAPLTDNDGSAPVMGDMLR